MKRAATIVFGLFALLGVIGQARGQYGYVQWGPAGSSATNGVLDATLISTTTGSNGVRYSNVDGLGYDVVVVTKGLSQDGESDLPWNGQAAWWYYAAAADESGQSIPYSTVTFRFYQQGTNTPIGLTGVNFSFQNAKEGERYRAFSYFDPAGNQVALSFTNYSVFSYTYGYPNIHQSDNSIDTGVPYSPGNLEGDFIGVNLSGSAVSGFTYQTGRVDSNYGSNLVTALGTLLPPGVVISSGTGLFIQQGTDTDVTAGPIFTSTGSSAVLTPATLLDALSSTNVAVLTGSSISQDILVNQDVVSNAGFSLTMQGSQNIMSGSANLILSATDDDAGSISLTATESVMALHLEANGTSGSGGAVTMNAGSNIGVTNGISATASGFLNRGGNVTIGAGGNIDFAGGIDSSANDYYDFAGNISLTAGESISGTGGIESNANGSDGQGGNISAVAAGDITITGGVDSSAAISTGSGGNVSIDSGGALTTDYIRTGGGGPSNASGAPGSITLTASDAINAGAIYDNSGSGYMPTATLTAPSIAIGLTGTNSPDISGTLYLEYPMTATGVAISLSGSMTGSGSVVINAGTGTASYFSGANYTGPTEMLSGVLDMQGNSLAQSDVILANTSSLVPGGQVEMNSLTVGTDATVDIGLTSTSTYDQIEADDHATLSGVLSVTLANGYIPNIGDTFAILNSIPINGEFGSYEGLRLGDRVLTPEFVNSGLELVTTPIPSGASLPLVGVPPTGYDVASNDYNYGGLTTGLQTGDGFNAAATLIDGAASMDTIVNMTMAATGTTDFELQGSIGGYLVNVTGPGNDMYVVQLDYKETPVLAAAGDERNLFLASTDGTSAFQNAVNANISMPGETNTPTRILGPYDPSEDFQLGYWGVDTVNNRVWAVVDYQGYFGVGAVNVSGTPSGPAAATETATGILDVSATLNGLVNFNGYNSTVVFESGTDPGLAGAAASSMVASGSTAGFTQVSYLATGLLPYTTYYFRVDSITTSGTEYGGILSFTTALSAINDWRFAYFGIYTNTGNAADTADPTGDGVPNLLKYATGLSPLVASNTSPVVSGVADSGGMSYLTLTFNEIADPILVYSVQSATNLAGPWGTIWSSTGESNTPGSITVRDTAPIGTGPDEFLRLEVSY